MCSSIKNTKHRLRRMYSSALSLYAPRRALLKHPLSSSETRWLDYQFERRSSCQSFRSEGIVPYPHCSTIALPASPRWRLKARHPHHQKQTRWPFPDDFAHPTFGWQLLLRWLSELAAMFIGGLLLTPDLNTKTQPEFERNSLARTPL